MTKARCMPASRAAAQVLGRARHGVPADVDHAVEVQHHQVVAVHAVALRESRARDPSPPLRGRNPYDSSEWTRRRLPRLRHGSRSNRPSGSLRLRRQPTSVTPSRTASSPDPTDRSPAAPARPGERASGSLRLDARPALYLHEYTSAGVSIRGLVALLDLRRRRGRGSSRTRTCTPTRCGSSPTGWPRCAQPGPDPAHAPRTRVSPRRADGRPPPARPISTYTDRADQLQRIWRITDPAELQADAGGGPRRRAVR